jgi:hypothetical protein
MAIIRRRGWSLEDRISDQLKIDPVTDCWEWQGCTNNIGYGFIRDGKRMRTVHRTSYELHYQTVVPDDICVYHTCSNYTCCNPKHLVTGLRKDITTHMYNQGHANAYGGNPQGTCPHCNMTMVKNMLHRWHNNNCKHKPTCINTLQSGNAYTPI